jgi:Mg-chelatase subunit ChlD
MRYFVAFALALCAGTALGAGTFLQGNFVERYSSDPHSFLNGTFYYYYENSNATKSRLRFVYNMPNGMSVSNLYHFEIGAMYSMCSSCSADTRTLVADKWWYDSNVYQKSSQQEGGKYWYTKKVVKNEDQVTRILMTEATTPTATSLAAIDFKDGRSIRVSNVVVNPSGLTASSPQFQLDANLNCPVPTCSMFADIIFVLDYSGSVSKTEWWQLAQFVMGVLRSFKFGDTGAAGACVKFTTSASILAAGTYNGKRTVTTDVDTLISVMNVNRTPSGGTYLGCGLDLAMQLFDNSPRRLYGNKPQNIVIAVTDGDDNSGYVSKTATAAAKIKAAPYDAFFMTIGVGVPKSVETRLKNLASTIDGSPAYFGVADYGKIKGAVDKVFSPLCEQFHSECGLDCKGFCGCGECLCPYCDVTGGKCEDYRCVARAGTSNGCVMSPLLECAADDKCVQHVCDESSGSAQCKDVYTCQEYFDKNPGTCRSVSCSLSNGKCSVTRDNTYCKQFNNPCEEWACAGENETATDPVSGCKIVVNKTADCQGGSPCIAYSCNMQDGSCVQDDLCTVHNHQCSTFTCDGKATGQCIEHPIPGPENTSCTTYNCDPKTGWYTVHEKTPEECADGDTDVCKKYKCDVARGGCTFDPVNPCNNELCQPLAPKCVQEATQTSTLDKCLTGACYVNEQGEDPHCNYDETNCFESEAMAQARQLNSEDPNVCYNVECVLGECKLVPQDKPTGEGKGDTACWINVCVYDEAVGFRWDRQESDVKKTCKPDACFYWECDDVDGCVSTPICSNKTNECRTFSCETEEDGTKKCVPHANPLRNTECLYEECDTDDVKHVIIKNLTEVCPNDNKCLYATCTDDGQCKLEAYPVPSSFSADQLECVVCDPKTGVFSFTCDDGLFCTNDECAVGGTCRHSEVKCYDILNMSTKNPKDYCFQPECEEKSDKYQCKRKKKAGTYIDLCGRCVDENGVPFGSEGSESDEECNVPDEDVTLKEPLAAATIAMIVIGAILIGAAVAMSSILGTKALLERAKAANNQSAHSNPLFEDNGKEMANPTFMEEVDVEG